MHSIYANAAAMAGYRTGAFPDGSVIVFDNHETMAVQGAELPRRRRFVDVMVKAGGSWRFGEFDGDSRTVRSVTAEQAQTQCAACHAKARTDHVYSQFNP
jgi:mono/diheme cytochrome c family protein